MTTMNYSDERPDGAHTERPHIEMVAGRICRRDNAPDLGIDRGGLPESVTEDEAHARVADLYEAARDAYASRRMRSADDLLFRMSAASGRFGLASAREEWGRR